MAAPIAQSPPNSAPEPVVVHLETAADVRPPDIPADIQPGRHTLVISALSADGEFIERRIPVSVVLPTPWWVWGALVMGVVFLIGALALVAVGLSKRRRARLASGHS
mgnify:CR=1 FL=1